MTASVPPNPAESPAHDFSKMVAAFLLFALGLVIVIENIKALTLPVLAFAGGALLLAMLLAFRTDTVAAFQAIVPFLPAKFRGDSHHD